MFSYYGTYTDENFRVSSAIFTAAGGDVFFLNNLSDTVYRTNSTGTLVEKIYFDFGSRRVPAEDKAELDYASYERNEQAFDEPLATALKSDKIALRLYSN